MKVQNHYNTAMNNVYRGNTSFSYGNKGASSDLISQKQYQAQEKAMGIIKRAFTSEKRIDDKVTRHKMRVASLESDIRRNNEEIRLISEKQKDLKDLFGVSNSDQEHKDLSLLLKKNVSQAEAKYLSELRKNGLSPYQQRFLEIENEKTLYKGLNEELLAEIYDEYDIIDSITEARKDYHPMKNATEAAEGILEAASKEIQHMVMQEIKNDLEKDSREFRKKLAENDIKGAVVDASC